MAGIYIHIPFCKSRCRYCDFYSTTMLDKREEYVRAVLEEARIRQSYLDNKTVHTIYFGGGTPSQLSVTEIATILHRLKELFQPADEMEITIEANPCDLTTDYLTRLILVGINRLSIGIQSFDDKRLKLLGRRHMATQAIQAFNQARAAGFTNISIDLIYGIPEQSISDWKQELLQAIELNPEHISTYCLSYEQGTPLTEMLVNNKITAVDDETENEMYAVLTNTLINYGYEQYEVSNFAKPNYHSRHNSSYWNGTAYLGLGAGAHSYNGKSRQWNQSDLDEYIAQVKSGNIKAETEYLTQTDIYNERVMLGLRTINGIDLSQFSETEKAYCLKQAQQFINSGQLLLTTNRLQATMPAINILNLITQHLMQLSD